MYQSVNCQFVIPQCSPFLRPNPAARLADSVVLIGQSWSVDGGVEDFQGRGLVTHLSLGQSVDHSLQRLGLQIRKFAKGLTNEFLLQNMKWRRVQSIFSTSSYAIVYIKILYSKTSLKQTQSLVPKQSNSVKTDCG